MQQDHLQSSLGKIPNLSELVNVKQVLSTYELVTESLILKYPDPHKRYVVFTDASDQAAAAVLTPEYTDDDGQMKEMPVAFFLLSSRILNSNGVLWSKRVMLSIMELRNGDTILKMQKFY